MPQRPSARPFRRVLSVAVAAALTLTGVATVASADAPTGTISGHVTVPDGVAVTEVRASVVPSSTGITQSVDVAADGSYAFDGLAPEPYAIWFWDTGESDLVTWFPGGARSSWDAPKVTVTAGGTATVDPSLVRGGRITGTVAGPGGAPVDGAGVQLLDTTGRWLDLYATTAPDGAFAVRGVPAGAYRVRVAAPSGGTLVDTFYGGPTQWTAATVTVEAGIATELGTTTLAEAGYVEGRAVSAGAVLASAFVSLLDAVGATVVSGPAQPDGTFRLVVAPGTYRLRVDAPAGSPATTTYWPGVTTASEAGTFTVGAGASTTLGDVDLPVGAGITGTVRGADGAPVPGVSVQAVGEWGVGSGFTTTAADGTYAIGGLTAGDYVLSFRPPYGSRLRTSYYDGKDSWSSADRVHVGGSVLTGVDATLQPGVCLTGTLHGPDGAAASGVSLSLEPVGGGDTPSPYGSTGPDGRFRLADGPAGAYRLSFQTWGTEFVTGYYPGSVPASAATVLTLGTDGCLDLGDVTIPVGGTLSGRVVGPDGSGVPGVSVTVSDDERAAYATSGADGVYVVRGLGTGDYVVRAGGSGDLVSTYYPHGSTRSQAERVHVTEGADTALDDLVLGLGATVSGTVTGPDGNPAASVMVLAEGPEVESDGPNVTQTDADGRFELHGVAPVPTTIRAESDAWSGGYLGIDTYYDGATGTQLRRDATALTAEAGSTVDGVRLVMPPRGTAAAELIATATPEQPVVGRTAQVHVSVAGSAAGTPTGPVELWGAGTLLGNTTLDAPGAADLTFVVPAGDFGTGMSSDPTLMVRYLGDARYDAQALFVPFDPKTAPVAIPPTIGGVDPAVGPVVGGTVVHVVGTGFTADATVTFGGRPADHVVVESPTSLRATAPAHAAGVVPVVVTTADGASDGGATFAYQQVPTVTTVTSSAGSTVAGTPVTFTATVTSPLGTPAGSVAFVVDGGTAQPVPLVDGVATLTTSALGVGAHAVSSAYLGDATYLPSSAALTQTVTAPPTAPKPPVVGIVLPPLACTAGGTTVVIAGTRLTGATAVTFGSTPGTKVTVLSDSLVSVRVPAHAAGVVTVRVTTPAGTSNASPFAFVAPLRGTSCPRVAS